MNPQDLCRLFQPDQPLHMLSIPHRRLEQILTNLARIVKRAAVTYPPSETTPELADPGHCYYWRRELEVYDSGLLKNVAGIRAPQFHGLDERPDGAVWLWLEHVQGSSGANWPLDRYMLAARHLGEFSGSWLRGHLPDDAWLSRDWLRGWSQRMNGPDLWALVREPEPWRHPLIRAAFSDAWAERYRRCADERPLLWDARRSLSPCVCHFDAYSRNLIGRTGPRGEEETVLVDWAFTGIGAIGEDVGQLAAASVVFEDVPAQQAWELFDGCLESYVKGLRAAGWHGGADTVRRGAVVTAALRWLPIAGWYVRWALQGARPHFLMSEERLNRSGPLFQFLIELAECAASLAGRPETR